jgi:hypothetical protein
MNAKKNVAPERELPKIYTVLPDEIRNMHAHGQWYLDTPGAIINFNCETIDHIPDVATWAEKLEAFRKSGEAMMEFESPHLPGRCFLHRAVLEHVIMTQPAWSAKVMARPRANGNVQLVDSETGLPVVRRKLD